MDANAPSEGGFSNSQELRFFTESLIKSIREGHIRVECDPGYPFEPVRLLWLADRIEKDESKMCTASEPCGNCVGHEGCKFRAKTKVEEK